MIPIRKTIAPCDHARYEEFILQETDDTYSGFDAKDGLVTITIHYADDSVKAEETFKDSGLAGAWIEQFKEMVEEATVAAQAEAEEAAGAVKGGREGGQ